MLGSDNPFHLSLLLYAFAELIHFNIETRPKRLPDESEYLQKRL